MAWIKIPAEHHPLFHAALPKDPRISTLLMFGGLAAKANGQMFAGLFARSAIAKLSAADQARALALDGATKFDPMGNGRVMGNTIQLPDAVMEEPGELRDWLRRAFDYVLTLPAKPAKGAKAPAAKARATKAATPRTAVATATARTTKRARAATPKTTAKPKVTAKKSTPPVKAKRTATKRKQT